MYLSHQVLPSLLSQRGRLLQTKWRCAGRPAREAPVPVLPLLCEMVTGCHRPSPNGSHHSAHPRIAHQPRLPSETTKDEKRVGTASEIGVLDLPSTLLNVFCWWKVQDTVLAALLSIFALFFLGDTLMTAQRHSKIISFHIEQAKCQFVLSRLMQKHFAVGRLFHNLPRIVTCSTGCQATGTLPKQQLTLDRTNCC